MTKILLVEDDKSLREIYGVRLLAEGYDIVSAGDGEEALAMAIKERPNLIVSDVMMPKISGFDMLDILRSTTETKSIKVIMMTALSSEDQRARGEALGADRYLVKSQVGIEDVVRTVHEVLGDAPTTQVTPEQSFATPAPSAAPRAPEPQQRYAAPSYSTSQPTPAVQLPVSDSPAPFQQAAAPVPLQQAAPAPTPAAQQSMTPIAPRAQNMAPAPAASLPLPTAPFSTPRPAGLGDRVINPIVQPPSDKPDIASMMSQELDMSTSPAAAQPSIAAPHTTAPPSQSDIPAQTVSQSQPEPTTFGPAPADMTAPALSQSPQPTAALQPSFVPTSPSPLPEASPTFTVPAQTPSVFAQPDQMHGATNFAFEETPLPQTMPQQAPSAQPPTAGTPS